MPHSEGLIVPANDMQMGLGLTFSNALCPKSGKLAQPSLCQHTERTSHVKACRHSSQTATAYLQAIWAFHIQRLDPHAVESVLQLGSVLHVGEVPEDAWYLPWSYIEDIRHVQVSVIQHCSINSR